MSREILNDKVLDGAAVLAYFFLLAVFPAALMTLSLLPSLSIPHLQEAILDLLHQVLPRQSANLFEVTVRYVASKGTAGLLTFELAFTLWSASTGVYAIMEQLNGIYELNERRPFWKARGTAILLMLALFLLVIGSLSLVIFGGVVQSWAASMIGWSRPLLIFFATLRWIIIAAALLLALAAIYRFGPNVNLPFRFISAGNVVAASLIALGAQEAAAERARQETEDAARAAHEAELAAGRPARDSQNGPADQTALHRTASHVPDFERHARLCTICSHPDCDAIEGDFVRWRSPRDIADDYHLPDRTAIYRHAHAVGLFRRRKDELGRVMEKYLENADYVPPEQFDIVTRAVRAYSHLDDNGRWFEPPRVNYIFAGTATAQSSLPGPSGIEVQFPPDRDRKN